jgi:hypothetical protein
MEMIFLAIWLSTISDLRREFGVRYEPGYWMGWNYVQCGGWGKIVIYIYILLLYFIFIFYYFFLIYLFNFIIYYLFYFCFIYIFNYLFYLINLFI